MKKIQAFFFALLFAAPIHSQVSLYTGPNHTGKTISLKDGNYKIIPQVFYNKVQSLKIEEGYMAELFSLPMYRGKKVVLASDLNTFPESWGNKTGSLKIFYPGKEAPDSFATINPWENMQEIEGSVSPGFPVTYNDTGNVILYSECNYEGKKSEINIGSYRSISALSISSIKIPGDKRIIVYSLPGFKGNSTLFNSDENCLLSNWNNKIGSIKVLENSLADLLNDTGSIKGSGLGGLGIKGSGSGGGGYGGGGGGIGSVGSGGWGSGSLKSGTGINVVIYDKCNFAGQNRSLGVGNYPAIPSALKISSFRIPAGKKLKYLPEKLYG